MPTIKTQFGQINLQGIDEEKLRQERIDTMLKLAQLKQLNSGLEERKFGEGKYQFDVDTELRRAALTQDEKKHLSDKDLAEKNLKLDTDYKTAVVQDLVAKQQLAEKGFTQEGEKAKQANTAHLAGIVAASPGADTDPGVLARFLHESGQDELTRATASTTGAPVDAAKQRLAGKLGLGTSATPVATPPVTPEAPVNVMELLKGPSLRKNPFTAPQPVTYKPGSLPYIAQQLEDRKKKKKYVTN